MSARGLDSYGRPMSRHRHTESGFSTQSMASPPGISDQGQGQSSAAPPEPRRRSGDSNPVSSLLQEQSDIRPSQATQRDPAYSAGPEINRAHDERRISPEGEDPRRANLSKRDDERN
jgi:hypothetical protein